MAGQMTENAGLRAVVSKAQIIDELENTLPGWLKRQGGNRWYPYYVHILKVTPPHSGHQEDMYRHCQLVASGADLDRIGAHVLV